MLEVGGGFWVECGRGRSACEIFHKVSCYRGKEEASFRAVNFQSTQKD